MNAPICTKLENIEAYKDLLPAGFIEETLARQQLILKNKEESLKSLEQIKVSCDSMSNKLMGLGNIFGESSNSFMKFEKACIENGSALEELGSSYRIVSNP